MGLAFNIWNINRQINGLTTTAGRGEYFKANTETAMKNTLQEIFQEKRLTELRKVAAASRIGLEGKLFFVDSLDGTMLASPDPALNDSTNLGVGGERQQQAFERIKKAVEANRGETVGANYILRDSERDTTNMRFGVYRLDDELGWIYGVVVKDEYFESIKNKLYVRIKNSSLVVSVVCLLSLMLLYLLFRQYLGKQQDLQEYKVAMSSTLAGVALLEEDSTVRSTNKRWKELYGDMYDGRKLVDISSYPFIKEKFDECKRENFASYRNQGLKDGELISSSVTLTKYSIDEETRIVLVSTDVTQVVETYRAVAHDFISSLLGPQLVIDSALMEAAKGNLRPEETERKLYEIQDHIIASQNYALAIYSWGKHEAGDILDKVEKVALGNIITRVVQLLNSTFIAHGVEVYLNIHEEIIIQTGSRSLEAVLRNLLTNSVRAFNETTRDRRITITLERSGREAIIRVEDTGKGMTAAVHDTIFEETNTQVGFGAKIIRAYMVRVGGSVSVEKSIIGEGTTIAITMPIA